jgi:hypothetical protein
LVDGKLVVSAADLRLVAGAGEGALGVVKLSSVDRVAAEADAIVFEAGVTETVALALGHTALDCHVRRVSIAAETEGIGADVFEAARVNEWLERRNASWEVNVPRLDVL